MDVLVDSCVWSLALRRNTPDEDIAKEIRSLVKDSRVRIIGPIRQEVLSGINNHDQYLHLRAVLGHFPDIELGTRNFEYAAELSNQCRAKGIQGSHTDFLMCAVAKTHKLAIFSTDKDFGNYSKIIHLSLFQLRS
jgi:predicted nucleic acid-binding protein